MLWDCFLHIDFQIQITRKGLCITSGCVCKQLYPIHKELFRSAEDRVIDKCFQLLETQFQIFLQIPLYTTLVYRAIHLVSDSIILLKERVKLDPWFPGLSDMFYAMDDPLP